MPDCTAELTAERAEGMAYLLWEVRRKLADLPRLKEALERSACPGHLKLKGWCIDFAGQHLAKLEAALAKHLAEAGLIEPPAVEVEKAEEDNRS